MHKTILMIFFLVFLAVPGLAQTAKVDSDSIPFAPAVHYAVGDEPRSVFCADLDGDSALDLAVANYGSDNNISILMNNGNGTFQLDSSYVAGDDPWSVFCADLDGDSALDLAVASEGISKVSILKNNGNGTFQLDGSYAAGRAPSSLFCADLDGDSHLDIAVASFCSDTVSILKNNGYGTFQLDRSYAAGDGPNSIFCADLDGDSALDLAVASEGVFIFFNIGNGTSFQLDSIYAAGDAPRSVFCADLDGDSDLDLAVANEVSDNVSILENNGDGTFQTAVNYGAGDGSFSVFCADLDGDTDLDLAVANDWSDSVSILLNQTISDDVEDDEGIVRRPEGYSLSQNHPNPFNQATKIGFALRRSGFVTLSIYDILGRKVKTLVSEHLSSGRKSVLWDGKSDSGKDVASGIYFYQMKVGDFTETKRLVLLK